MALVTMLDGQLRVLVVQRDHAPASQTWALPGGILRPDLDKSLNDKARRVLAAKPAWTSSIWNRSSR
jgi:8-oxo-dGTP diphosphatase